MDILLRPFFYVVFYAILLPQKSARKGGARVEVDILLPAPVRSILSTLQFRLVVAVAGG